MNFRITAFFFAMLLTMLWVFGLMIAHKKAAGDKTVIMPTLSGAKIEKVLIKRTKEKDVEPFDAELVFEGGLWYLKDAKSNQKVRVEGWRIDGIAKLIQNAKHDESADVNKGLAAYGLDKPRIEVTLETAAKADTEAKKWTLSVGDERAGLAYVTTSEQPDKVFAVQRKSLDPLFFKDPNELRSKRLFDFGETGVTKIDAKRGADELIVDRKPDDANSWTFIKPKYGPAGIESDAEDKVKDKKKNPFEKEPAPTPTGGIRGLLNNISAIQVDGDDNFEPLGSPMEKYGLEPGKETMRIKISSANEKGDGVSEETLYIGKRVPGRTTETYYAKMENDSGVVKLLWSRLEPIAKAIEDPGKLRSRDVAVFDRKLVDAAVIKQGKDDLKFFKGESSEQQPRFPGKPPTVENWEMVVGSEKKKASDTMIHALLDQVLGKKAIVTFHDGKEEDLKKKEAEWSLDAASNPAEIAVYIGGIEKDKKDAKPEDTKKDGDKKDADKKDEPAKDGVTTLKKDAKAEVTLAIGKIDGEIVNVRRTLKDGSVTWFTLNKSFVEKVLPPQIELAYLDTSLPSFGMADVVSIKLARVTDKGPEALELSRRFVDDRPAWFIKDSLDPTGYRPAETGAIISILGDFSQLQAKKWIGKAKTEDLEKYGLNNPAVKVTLAVTTPPKVLAAIIGLMCIPDSLLPSAVGVSLQSEAGEPVTIEFGKETDDPKEKPATFARHSGSPLVFLVPSRNVKFLKDVDLRDRTSMLFSQVEMEAMCRANAAINPTSALMFASPYFTGAVQQVDPKVVTKVRLTVRTPFELRSFEFDRKEKDDKVKAKEPEKGKDDKAKDNAKDEDWESKWTWVDKSGLQEFQLDPDKVAQVVKDFSKLHTDRFVAFAGGQRSEHKLDPKDATIKLELTTKDGTVTLLIGANFPQHGGYFARTSAWPEVVFLVPRTAVAPLLDGTGYFAKPRSNVD